MGPQQVLQQFLGGLQGDLAADQQSIAWKPVNSCMQMLPALDGKAVKTIESLKRADGSLAWRTPVSERLQFLPLYLGRVWRLLRPLAA